MQKTIKTLFLLTIITGTFLTGCGPTIKDPTVKEEDASGVVVEDKDVEEKDMDAKEEDKDVEGEDDVKIETKGTVEVKSEEVKKEEATTKYKDGAYSATGAYSSPAGQESIIVNITLENDNVKAMTVGTLATNETSKLFQGKFQSGIGAMVIGKPIDQIGGYAQVNGSSLTPKGFDNALNIIRGSAQNS